MPELPEVETIRRGLAAAMEGRRLEHVTVNRGDLRRPLPADFANRLEGRTVERVGRRAKYLVIELDDQTVLLIHLGMSGHMVFDPAGDRAQAAPHGRHEHVVFETGNGTRVRYSDPRRFGLMALISRADLPSHPLLAHLGPEPLGKEITGRFLVAAFHGRKTPVKAALLDQTVIAGLGNIYVCESLFRAGISPRRRAANVKGVRAGRLAPAIQEVLSDAIAAGGSTLRDHVTPTGEIGYFQHSFRVYGREGEICTNPGCVALVRRIVQSGRSSFYCPSCQR